MTQKDLPSILFVGLGNPGRQYEMTRHNMGYLVIQAFAKRLGWSFKEDHRFNAMIVKGSVEGREVHLLLPLTYMNLSGQAVMRYMHYFKIPFDRLVVITDDVALAFGKLRLRGIGSAGGHNGLKSIESSLGTSHYKRLRMGIGHPGERVLADYVLEMFDPIERQCLPVFIDSGVEILQRLLKENFSHVMTSVNSVLRQEKLIKPEVEVIDLTKPPVTGRGE